MIKRSLAASALVASCAFLSVGATLLTSSVSGTINASSSPSMPNVEDVNVHAVQGNSVMGSSRSDDNGHYEISELEAGVYTLELAKAHFVKTLVPNVTLGNGENKVLHAKIIPSLQLASASGASSGSSRWRIRNQHDFSVNYEWRIAGTNTFGNGVAAPGDSTFDTPSLQSGQTLLLLVNGVVVRKKGGNGKDIAPDTGTTFGTVHDSTNTVLSQVTVSVRDNANQLIASALTGADGTYQIDNLPAATYNLEFSKAGYANVVTSGVVVAAGSATVQNAILTQLAQVEVIVTVGGVGVEGATVMINYNDGTTSPAAATDSAGVALIVDQPTAKAAVISVVLPDGSSMEIAIPGGFTPGTNSFNAPF